MFFYKLIGFGKLNVVFDSGGLKSGLECIA